MDPKDPNGNDLLMDVVADILNAASPAADRMSCRRRRLLRAFADLGLLDVVGGAYFVRIADNGLEFAALDDSMSDRFISLLEDLADQAPRRQQRSNRAQLSLGDL